ncbi:MAG: EF-P lysine aminoacylase GenX [Gammaproteobacteria bacterium]|nr:EF-P lysine aminoacylase GenX [Gammaproteobacteria bacterium]
MRWRSAAGQDALVVRARLLAAARSFFASRDILEVQTPVLISSTCTDPNIPSVAARYRHDDAMYLRTSPEHAMKRLLCSGSGDIWQIGPVFRNGELGRYHNPEFTMIEWYRHGFDHHDMADETVALILHLLQSQAQITRMSYAEIFLSATGLDPHRCAVQDLQDVLLRFDINTPASMGNRKDDWLDLTLSTVVLPTIDPNTILIIYDYPESQSALARIRHDSPPVAERFEVFSGGVELANGFHELADAEEQRQRFLSEQDRCRKLGIDPPPRDHLLLQAMEHGLPDCAGVALGFDRLLMLATGSQKLADVIAFPFDRV